MDENKKAQSKQILSADLFVMEINSLIQLFFYTRRSQQKNQAQIGSSSSFSQCNYPKLHSQ